MMLYEGGEDLSVDIYECVGKIPMMIFFCLESVKVSYGYGICTQHVIERETKDEKISKIPFSFFL